MDYVPQDAYGETVEFLANYHRSREILEAICEINRELFRRREAHSFCIFIGPRN